MMQKINDLDLTQEEKALIEAAIGILGLSISNVGILTVDDVKKLLGQSSVIRVFFSLDKRSLRDVANLMDKLYEQN